MPETRAPLRFSQLKLMGRSPAHVRFALDQQAAGITDWDDTPSRKLGRLAHAVFLEQQLPVVFPGPRRAGKEWEAFKESHAGEEIVKQSELDAVVAMAAALAAHPEASKVLQGTRETKILFDLAGRNCRATPDVFLAGRHLTDLKTTNDANPRWFPYAALRYAYHAQLAFYLDGLGIAGFDRPKELRIVAVETKPPYAVAVFGVTPRAEELGRRLYRSWFEEFLVCEASDSWPSYPMGVIDAPEDAIELEIGGETLEVSDDEVPVTAPGDLEQGELPLIGLPPPAAAGIMPSKLNPRETADLAARRAKLKQQAEEIARAEKASGL